MSGENCGRNYKRDGLGKRIIASSEPRVVNQ
jgi:hypothetical protein